MQYITVGAPSFSMERVENVLTQVGEPDGLEARYVGTAGDEIRIVSLWESKAHADRFFSETLAPVLAKELGPEPSGTSEVEGIEIARSFQRKPVA